MNILDGYRYKTNKENIQSIRALRKNDKFSKGIDDKQYILSVLNQEVRSNRPIISYSIY